MPPLTQPHTPPPSGEALTRPAPSAGEGRGAFSFRWLLLPLVVFSVAAAVVYDMGGVLFHQSRKAQALRHLKTGMTMSQADRVLTMKGYITMTYSERIMRIYTTSHYSRVAYGARILGGFLRDGFPGTRLHYPLNSFDRWYEKKTGFLVRIDSDGNFKPDPPDRGLVMFML